MSEEQSIKDQIAAMEGWAIKAKQNADSGKYQEAEELLRTINVQGRRLEWRRKNGLRHLPDMEEVDILKKRITEARAAAQKAKSGINNLNDSVKALKKLNEKLKEEETDFDKTTTTAKKAYLQAKIQATKQDIIGKNEKINGYRKETGKSMPVMIQVLKEARTILSRRGLPWMDKEVLIKPENHKILLQLLKNEGYYKNLSKEERRDMISGSSYFKEPGIRIFGDQTLWRSSRLSGVDLGAKEGSYVYQGIQIIKTDCNRSDFRDAILNGVNFEGSIFYGSDFDGAGLSEANLNNTNFSGTRLRRAILINAVMNGADFTNADLTGAEFSIKSSLFETNLNQANLKDVIGLTKEQLHSAKNWQKAKNIPKELL